MSVVDHMENQLARDPVDAGYSPHNDVAYTVAWFIKRLRQDKSLRPSTASDMISRLRIVARLQGLPEESVLLTPAALRRGYLGRTAAEHGLSVSAARNTMWALRRALRREGLIDDGKGVLSDRWAQLVAQVPELARSALAGFGRFCSARQIGPEAVDLDSFAAFEDWVAKRTIVIDPRKHVSRIKGTWNRAARQIAGWPGRPVGRRRDPNQYVLPLAAFSAGFRRDLEAFGAHLCADMFGLDGDDEETIEAFAESGVAPPRKVLRPSTVALRRDHCRWAASAAVASGTPIEAINELADLVRPLTRARNAIGFLYHRAGDKPSAAGWHVAEALGMVARHWVRLPPECLDRLKAWRARVTPNYERMTAKNERQIRTALTPACDEALLALPQARMEVARRMQAESPRQAATIAMRAVAIGLLLHIPLRLANVAGLRLDQHLQRADPTQPTYSAILIPAEEVKNGRPLTLPVPEAVNALLEEWVTVFRPLIAAPDCVYLFPGMGTGNRPVTHQGLREAIARETSQYAGVRLTPHQFRHLAAVRYLRAYPGCYELVRQLLGHADLQTTTRSYCSQEDQRAVELYDDVLKQHLHARAHARQEAPSTAKAGWHPQFRKGRR